MKIDKFFDPLHVPRGDSALAPGLSQRMRKAVGQVLDQGDGKEFCQRLLCPGAGIAGTDTVGLAAYQVDHAGKRCVRRACDRGFEPDLRIRGEGEFLVTDFRQQFRFEFDHDLAAIVAGTERERLGGVDNGDISIPQDAIFRRGPKAALPVQNVLDQKKPAREVGADCRAGAVLDVVDRHTREAGMMVAGMERSPFSIGRHGMGRENLGHLATGDFRIGGLEKHRPGQGVGRR